MESMKLLACLLISAFALAAQTLSGEALVKALQQGGYVIVMRHAASPRTPPATPNADNTAKERQLDEEGRATAAAMGKALKALKIPAEPHRCGPAAGYRRCRWGSVDFRGELAIGGSGED